MRIAPLLLPWALACSAPAPLPPGSLPSLPGPALVAAGSAAPLPLPSAAAASCPDEPAPIGRIEETELNEISGVVESRANPGIFYVHNDSGDSARFFAIDRRGTLLAELELSSVPLLIDAEDIAIGPAPNGASYIYVGDTGNNFASMGLGIPRRKAVLYRVLEPRVTLADRNRESSEDAFPIVFSFPAGARDIEAFFVDPLGGDLYLIGKQKDGHSTIFSASAATLAAGGGQLEVTGELLFGRRALPGSPLPTSASISGDGRAILVRSYSSVFLFRRDPGESVLTALLRAPRQLPSPPEQQGEAIGFADGDAAFVTISEGVKPAIYCGRLPRK
jgi:hypothetical protein